MIVRDAFLRAAWLGSVGAALLTAAPAWAQVQFQFQQQPGVPFTFQVANDADGGEGAPAYWIGLSCDEDLNASLRAQLGLAEDQGLLVLNVAQDSPAEKAGLKEHDVLIAAGGKPLKSIRDLVSAVQEAKEGELAVDLFRGGKPESIAVQPSKRPEPPQPGAGGPDQPGFFGGNPEQFRKMIEQWHKQLGGGQPRDFRMFVPRPGMMLPPGSPMVVQSQAPLPADMTLSITKQGAEPAKIVVTQGDKTFEATEDKLGDLPEDVRQHVENFLGRQQFTISLNAQPFAPGQAVPAVPAQPGQALPAPPVQGPQPAQPGRPGRLRRQGPGPDPDDRFEQIQQELRKLQQAIDDLKRQGPK